MHLHFLLMHLHTKYADIMYENVLKRRPFWKIHEWREEQKVKLLIQLTLLTDWWDYGEKKIVPKWNAFHDYHVAKVVLGKVLLLLIG